MFYWLCMTCEFQVWRSVIPGTVRDAATSDLPAYPPTPGAPLLRSEVPHPWNDGCASGLHVSRHAWQVCFPIILHRKELWIVACLKEVSCPILGDSSYLLLYVYFYIYIYILHKPIYVSQTFRVPIVAQVARKEQYFQAHEKYPEYYGKYRSFHKQEKNCTEQRKVKNRIFLLKFGSRHDWS